MATSSARSRSAAGARRPRTAANATVAPEELRPAPIVLLTGAESVLADRAWESLLQAARADDPQLQVHRIEAASYGPGMLSVATSPSLFGGGCVVLIEALEQATDALVRDLQAYLAPGVAAPDACVVVRHSGAARARQVVEAARAAGAVEVSCQPLTRDDEKVQFATAEVQRVQRRMSPAAARALVAAVGSDLRELQAGCRQLAADTESDPIDVDDVERYFGGRVEVTGFRVADAAVSGQADQALGLLRQALDSGADPVPLVAAVAAKVRAMAKVSAAGSGSAADLARQLGLAPWQVDRARRDLQRWSAADLARAVQALADADTMVKGGGRDPVYAVERLVTLLAMPRWSRTAATAVRPRRILR